MALKKSGLDLCLEQIAEYWTRFVDILGNDAVGFPSALSSLWSFVYICDVPLSRRMDVTSEDSGPYYESGKRDLESAESESLPTQ